MDESAGVHEFTMGLLAPYQFTDFLLFSWIVPYAIACFVIGLIYLAALPPGVRWRVILAGALFVASALGDESIGARCETIGNMTCFQLEVVEWRNRRHNDFHTRAFDASQIALRYGRAEDLQ